jgi:hypothetical protein
MKSQTRLSACAVVILGCSTLLGDGWGAAPAAQDQRAIRSVRRDAVQSAGIVRPLVVQAGKVRRIPHVGIGSPYFAAQFGGAWAPPLTLIEIDYWNTADAYLSKPDAGYNPPLGVDQRTVTIDPGQKDFAVNFRYSTGDAGAVGMLWQISRFPFANNPANWERVPGLVATGTVKTEHTDSDGYRYFRINFARVASHKMGASPYFEGTATLKTDPDVAGPPAALPRADPGLRISQRPPAVRITPAPAARSVLRLTAPAQVEQDQTFYVRVVPLHQGGAAGIPAIPVEVTVLRPRPCPTSASDITVRPPSARIVWYMRPNFFDSQDASGHWFVVHGDQFNPQNAHMLEVPKPEDKAWYEKIIDVFKSVINYFSDMMTAMSNAYDLLQDMYVEAYAKYWSYAISGGTFMCNEHEWCKKMVKSGLHKTMTMAGIPPTLPTGPELLTLSREYVIELGADTFGVRDLYDGYEALPAEAKEALKKAGRKITDEFTQSEADARKATLDKYLCYDVPDLLSNETPKKTKQYCTPRVPDPIFNSIHPATVLVWVENTNSGPTQRILLSVTDSMGLFRPGTVLVPELRPGQGLSVPVILNENTTQFMDYNKGKCSSKDFVTVSGVLPCPMQAWRDKFFQVNEAAPSPDTFRVTFSTGSGAATLSGIDAQSSGKPLPSIIVRDDGAAGGFCAVSSVVSFPPGWTIQTPTRGVIPEKWDNLFAVLPGQEGNPNNGQLRNK